MVVVIEVKLKSKCEDVTSGSSEIYIQHKSFQNEAH